MIPRLRLVREGETELLVPAGSLLKREPDTYPVFFNPAARVNRDISVSLASQLGAKEYLDVLCGVGARGVRVARECGRAVTMVDFNTSSLAIARRNARRNGVSERCEVVHGEANRFLYSRFDRLEKFPMVDVDPFGTPAPYVMAALAACSDGAVLSVTATDSAVLCGVYPRVAARRYGSASSRNEFPHETGMRMLVAFCARMGGANEIGVQPVAAHSTLHYFRLYMRVRRGASHADASVARLGYVTQCGSCHHRVHTEDPVARCERCGGGVRSAGPLWTGGMVDEGLTSGASEFCRRRGWAEPAAILASLSGLDSFPPFSYSLERACSREKVASVSPAMVRGALRERGFASMAQPFEEASLKTPAPYEEVASAVRASAREP